MAGELLFVLGSPRAFEEWRGGEPDSADMLACADWVTVSVSVNGSSLEIAGDIGRWLPDSGCMGTRPESVVAAGQASGRREAVHDILAMLGTRCGIYLQIEGTPDWRTVAGLVQEAIYRSGWHHGQFLIGSRSCLVIEHMRRFDPELRMGLIVDDVTAYCAELAEKAGAYSVHVAAAAVNQPLVRRCHEQGCVVIAHGANDIPHIELLARMGVDGVATTYPSRYLRWHRSAHPRARCRLPARMALFAAT